MHELSIAQAILDRVADEVRRHPGARPRLVGVKIGEISGVACDALAFGFEVLVKDTPWEPLRLEIDFRPRRHRCRACHREFAVSGFDTACPGCGSLGTELVSGDEMDLAFIEVDDA